MKKFFIILSAVLAMGIGGKAMANESFTTKSGKTVSFDLYYHASLCIDIDGYKIQVDPVEKKGVVSYDNLSADMVLITHEHGDHYSPDALNKLVKGNTVLITNPKVAELYGKGQIMHNGDTLSGQVSIKAVPAYNTSPDKQKFHPKGRDNGYIIEYDGLRIYIAGDTEPVDEMKNLGSIDIAFLPCNLPYTMDIEQFKEAALMIKPKVLYPYHFSQTDLSSLEKHFAVSGIDYRYRENMR